MLSEYDNWRNQKAENMTNWAAKWFLIGHIRINYAYVPVRPIKTFLNLQLYPYKSFSVLTSKNEKTEHLTWNRISNSCRHKQFNYTQHKAGIQSRSFQTHMISSLFLTEANKTFSNSWTKDCCRMLSTVESLWFQILSNLSLPSISILKKLFFVIEKFLLKREHNKSSISILTTKKL